MASSASPDATVPTSSPVPPSPAHERPSTSPPKAQSDHLKSPTTAERWAQIEAAIDEVLQPANNDRLLGGNSSFSPVELSSELFAPPNTVDRWSGIEDALDEVRQFTAGSRTLYPDPRGNFSEPADDLFAQFHTPEFWSRVESAVENRRSVHSERPVVRGRSPDTRRSSSDIYEAPNTAERFARIEEAIEDARHSELPANGLTTSPTDSVDLLPPPTTAERWTRIEAAIDEVRESESRMRGAIQNRRATSPNLANDLLAPPDTPEHWFHIDAALKEARQPNARSNHPSGIGIPFSSFAEYVAGSRRRAQKSCRPIDEIVQPTAIGRSQIRSHIIDPAQPASKPLEPPTTAERWALIEAAIDEFRQHNSLPIRERRLTTRRSLRQRACSRQQPPSLPSQQQPVETSTDHISRTHDSRRSSVSHVPLFDAELPPLNFGLDIFNSETALNTLMSSPLGLKPERQADGDDDGVDPTPLNIEEHTAEGVEVRGATVPQPDDRWDVDGTEPSGTRYGGTRYLGREELSADMDILRSEDALGEFLRRGGRHLPGE